MNEQQVYSQPPLPIRSQAETDAEHLSILVTCHYVAAVLVALFSCMFLMHVAIGVMMIHYPATFNSMMQPGPGGQHVPVQPFPFNPGYFFATAGIIAVLTGWTTAALTAYAGRSLKRRRHYVFVLIIAAVNCALMNPISTALGVFSLIVLLRPTVKLLFEGRTVIGGSSGSTADQHESGFQY